MQHRCLLTLNKMLSSQLGSTSHVINAYPWLIALFVSIIMCTKYSTALLNVYSLIYISCRLKIARSVKLIEKERKRERYLGNE